MALLRTALLVSLFLTFALSLASFAVEIHSLISSNDDKDKIKKYAAKTGGTASINTNDVLNSGYVLTAALGLTFVSALAFLALNALRKAPSLLQPLLLAFSATWVFACLVPFTLFVATREAKVHATLGGLTLTEKMIEGIERSLGVTHIYRDIDYLRTAAILPWFAFLSAIISVVLLLLERRRAARETVRDEPKY